MSEGVSENESEKRPIPGTQSSPDLMIYTVGHSTLGLADFLELLRNHRIERLVDIRTIPRSQHNPQFNQDTLRTFLKNHRISYRHMKELGGLRRSRADSPNSGWRNASFRGFADYMQTEEFTAGIEHLLELAREKVTAIMCAEAVPWRCHRSLIGDALVIRGVTVREVIGQGGFRLHTLTSMAHINGLQITYPAQE